MVVSCYVASSSKSSWPINSGYAHHMSSNVVSFQDLDNSYISRMRIGNEEYIVFTRIGNVEVETTSGKKKSF